MFLTSRAGKIARGSRAGSSSLRLGSARLGAAREPPTSRAEPTSQARENDEPSRAEQARELSPLSLIMVHRLL